MCIRLLYLSKRYYRPILKCTHTRTSPFFIHSSSSLSQFLQIIGPDFWGQKVVSHCVQRYAQFLHLKICITLSIHGWTQSSVCLSTDYQLYFGNFSFSLDVLILVKWEFLMGLKEKYFPYISRLPNSLPSTARLWSWSTLALENS